MASIAKQEAFKNPNAVEPPPPPSSATSAFIQLSSSDSDSWVADDVVDSAINNGDSTSAKRPRVSDGEIPLKKPKLEDDILPLGFLDPLPPEDPPEVVIAPPISVLPPPLPPPRVMPVLRSCKQFWKAGDYDGQPSADLNTVSVGMDHVRVHPKFLHSNATSHKWALGALAELLDNSMDEVSHGATFVKVDMLKNTKDGTKMLLVEDNGGGMDPDKMRQCMSLGYSVKSKSANTIGQYGNGFKTSTMRLGADVIVFSRCCGKEGRSCTQSIGLLSYTFLTNTGKEDIVVPMIDYVKEGDVWTKVTRSSADVWKNNLETIIRWSPYYSEADLLQQFNIMTDQGTRIVIYNLWDDDQGELELDFDADQHDIQVRGANRDEKKIQMAKQFPNSRHFLTYRHSLRSYASILYLKLPHGFRMILRGKDIEHHNIVNDMMLKQEVTYRPQPGPDGVPKDPSMVAVVAIGFVKDAKDHIDVQGFNVYHKNRLIKPFWRVWNAAGSDGRGVIGILEANFVQPAHDKQGFERTTVLSRLEARLLVMQKSYWTTNCHKIGYAPRRNKKLINGSEDRESSPEDPPQFSRKVPPKGLSSDVSKNCKTHDSSSHQNSNKSLHSSHNMTENSASQSFNGAEKYDKDVQFTPRASCGGAGVQPLPAISNLKAADITCNGNGPVTKNSFQQLTDENKTLKNRLTKLEESMLCDLQYERDKNKDLTGQIKALEEKLEVLNNEQEALINIFQEERSRREMDEENLKNKLKEATATIQDLVGKLYSEPSHTKKEL